MAIRLQCSSHDRAIFVDCAGSSTARQHRCFFHLPGDLTGYCDRFRADRIGGNVLARVPYRTKTWRVAGSRTADLYLTAIFKPLGLWPPPTIRMISTLPEATPDGSWASTCNR